MEKCPDHTLVAGRCRQGAIVAIVASQILRQQGLDVKGWDVRPLVYRGVWRGVKESETS